MAKDSTSTTASYYSLSLIRQVGLLVGLAVSVALGVGVVLWAQETEYRIVFSGSNKDAGDVITVLEQQGISYKVAADSGAILVPADKLFSARMMLAKDGLPKGNNQGFELLEKKQAFGVSQFIERARFRHALEGELARTIESMDNVLTARVHLAIPKQPVFVRDRRKPSASVFVDVPSGQTLQHSQVDAIVNLVASSIAEMDASGVTVVDQKGTLLTDNSDDKTYSLATKQLRLKREIEGNYRDRILTILAPVLGRHRVRAQVSASLDFTMVEKTSEIFSPDTASVRSSQVVSERTNNNIENAAGVPGALSNVPVKTKGVAASEQEKSLILHETRNYELDKTISHTTTQPWKLLRVSAAVAVDDQIAVNDDGSEQRSKLGTEEIANITKLVEDAIGFSEQRGDSVNVVNISFATVPPPEEAEPLQFWMEPWFSQVVKYVVAGIFLLVLLLGILRPILRSLVTVPASSNALLPGAGGDALGDDQLSLGQQPMTPSLPEPSSAYTMRVDNVKNLVRSDPGKVAQVVMNWVGEDDEQ